MCADKGKVITKGLGKFVALNIKRRASLKYTVKPVTALRQ
jgi:hypothetical protein